MDTYRGIGGDRYEALDDAHDDGDALAEAPPPAIGNDERRMQVRAYNYWASLLGDRSFPQVDSLKGEVLPDFAPHAVLLDFTGGIENPAVAYLGDKLAEECGAHGPIHWLSDVPGRSLLSRITDHYMQILANQAPIGFEAEFVNQRERTILYRGILLPFSSDDRTIDYIYGVINWKELADQHTTDELLLDLDQALEVAPLRAAEPLTTAWADGPVSLPANPLDAGQFSPAPITMPAPTFGGSDDTPAPFELAEEATTLADWLASAREFARAAHSAEDRSRSALYAAIGRAYDFALAAQDSRQEFADLLADAGLKTQDRAPMTPVVKLVFGADYDKTRLTEYAAALAHGQRMKLPRGTLGRYLTDSPGGLKAVVQSERKLRRDESGKTAKRKGPEVLAARLRTMPQLPFADLPREGAEITLLVARRLPSGEIALLGEVTGDPALVERAARRLAG
jgi:hypothetical protein